MTPPTRRRGSALIIVLLLLTLLVAVTVSMASRGATDARRMENRLTDLQGQYAMQGALEHAIAVLRADLAADEKALTEQSLPMADWSGEPWATAIPAQPLGDGTYGFAITDEQARWNVNALVDGAGNSAPAEKERFERLLAACCPGVETSAFERGLLDWIDADSDGDFEQGAPNRALLTTKELFLVPGATSEILTGANGRGGLLPRLTRWTSGPVNVNTASWEVLYAISDKFNAGAFARLEAARPLRTLDDLKGVLGLPLADPLPPDLASTLTVRSTFFRVALSFAKGGDERHATAIVLKVHGQPARLWWDPDPVCP